MTSTKSWLNFTLLKDNFKRFWGLIAVSTLLYFMTGPFAIILAGQNLSEDTFTVLIAQGGGISLVWAVTIPVVFALAVFGYLHSSKSSGTIHAMPFSRKSLFITNCVSGLLMSFVPVVINALLLMLLKRPVYGRWINEAREILYDVYTVKAVLFWMICIAVVSLFVFALSVLAASVSGIHIIQLLTSFGFNYIVPAIWLIFVMYAERYYFGFVSTDQMFYPAIYAHPMIKFLGFKAEPKDLIIYTLVSLLVLLIAFFAYKLRKNERAGDSYVFNPIKQIIGFLLTFIFTSLGGYAVEEVANSFAGYVICFIISAICATMIINKSTKVFSKKNLLSVAVYGLLTFCIILSFQFLDIVGYESHIPDASNVESVTLMSSFDLNLDGQNDIFYETENIEYVQDIHRAIIANKDRILDYINMPSVERPYDYYDDLSYFRFRYRLKDGSVVERSYNYITEDIYMNTDALSKLAVSDENRKSIEKFTSFDPKDVNINIYSNILSDSIVLNYGEETSSWKAMLLEALNKDVNAGLDRLTAGGVFNYTEWKHFREDGTRESAIDTNTMEILDSLNIRGDSLYINFEITFRSKEDEFKYGQYYSWTDGEWYYHSQNISNLGNGFYENTLKVVAELMQRQSELPQLPEPLDYDYEPVY